MVYAAVLLMYINLVYSNQLNCLADFAYRCNVQMARSRGREDYHLASISDTLGS
jgi:hypothetical protein